MNFIKEFPTTIHIKCNFLTKNGLATTRQGQIPIKLANLKAKANLELAKEYNL
jgi:hypothetical protein